MTIFEMLGQSGVLTLLGMGIVFGFLLVLVIAISMMGRLLHEKGTGSAVLAVQPISNGAETKSGLNSVPAGTGNNPQITAAISAAVNEYRKSN